MSTNTNDPEKLGIVLISTQEQAIEFSNLLLEAFRLKSKEHNKKHKTRVTANQLQKVYSEGVNFHVDYKCNDFTKNEWGLARISSFLRLVSRNSKVDLKVQNFKPKSPSKTIVILSATNPNEGDFLEAQKDIEKYNLNFEFETIDDLFLTSLYSKTNQLIEIK